MAEPAAVKLYSPELLALSAALADYPLVDDFQFNAEASSRTCGSAINIGLDTDFSGNVRRIGMQVRACAVGQSSAAIFAQGITGRSATQIEKVSGQLRAWLQSGGPQPDWPGIEALQPALPYPGRHDAIVLPWRAAMQALSTAPSSS